MFAYHLASDVYVCASDAGAVLLDLETDAYVGLDVNQSYALSLVVEGWPPEAAAVRCEASPSSDDALALAQILCDGRLLIRATDSHERRAGPGVVPTIEAELMCWEHMNW